MYRSSSIEPLSALTRLEFLDLRANQLATLDSLSPIRNMNWLCTLKLAGNPFLYSLQCSVADFPST
jgi:Leucine-rich repeat (LRR) protein